MELYLLRHGDAEPARPGALDRARELTEKGRRQAQLLSVWLSSRRLNIGSVITSPYPRAYQTAEPVAAALGIKLIADERIAAGRLCLQALAQIATELGPPRGLLVVGHEPDLSETIAELIGGGAIVMKKAGLALVEGSGLRPGACALAWLMPPSLLKERVGPATCAPER